MTGTANLNTAGGEIDIGRERYSGWLNGIRTLPASLDAYRTECLVDFSSGWSELRRFSWSQSLQSTWHTGSRCYFLSLVVDGTTETNRRNVALAQVGSYGGRRVSLIPPDQTIVSVSPASGETRSLRCVIDATAIESICSRAPSHEERAQLGTLDFSGSAIEWLLFRMYREISHDEIGASIAVDGIAREIAVEIARTFERRRKGAARHGGGLPAWRMRLLLERMYAEGPLPKAEELAQMCGMTVRHLRRAFQAETGKTLGAFVSAAMAERGGKMLEAGVPAGAVAATLGYASSSSFAHAFHRETGVLPSSWRSSCDRLKSS